jgi:hypothetical protein
MNFILEMLSVLKAAMIRRSADLINLVIRRFLDGVKFIASAEEEGCEHQACEGASVPTLGEPWLNKDVKRNRPFQDHPPIAGRIQAHGIPRW